MSHKRFWAAWKGWCGFILFLAAAVMGQREGMASNDQFANATAIFGLTNFTASNVGATVEPGEPQHAGEPTESTLWWRWTVPFTATFSIVTTNSMVDTNVALDTVAAVYQGNSLANLTQVVANDDTPYGEYGATWSRCVFRAYAGETFMIAIGSLGATGTIRVKIDVAGPPLLPFQVDSIYGGPLPSTNFSGQVLMIDFWEIICGACVTELPDLIRVQSALVSRGFTFLGLSGDARVSEVLDYIVDRGINYPMAMGSSALQTSLAGQFLGYPTKILVDRESRVVGIYLNGNTEQGYRDIIEPLLRSNSLVRASITREGGNVNIQWPSTEKGYSVESSPRLAGASWSNVIATPTITNGQNRVTLPATDGSQFFRLRAP